jgi:hypothetical protein
MVRRVWVVRHAGFFSPQAITSMGDGVPPQLRHTAIRCVGHLASWAADINQSALLLQFLLKSFKPPYVKVVVKAIATLVKDTQARKQIGPQAGELVKIIQHSASLGIDQDGSVFSFCYILVRFQWFHRSCVVFR